MNVFSDTAAILNSFVVSNSYYGMLRESNTYYVPREHNSYLKQENSKRPHYRREGPLIVDCACAIVTLALPVIGHRPTEA